jgi:hypothetical protein
MNSKFMFSIRWDSTPRLDEDISFAAVSIADEKATNAKRNPRKSTPKQYKLLLGER